MKLGSRCRVGGMGQLVGVVVAVRTAVLAACPDYLVVIGGGRFWVGGRLLLPA